MLQHIGVLPPEGGTMLTNGRIGQRSVEDLVVYYAIRCGPVRDLLVRYLKERAPGLDYATLRGLAATLANLFWADLEEHHPGIDTLHLPEAVAEGWKERLRTYTTKKGETRPRKDYRVQLGRIRAFYLDLQEWALHDATWATWAAPSPVRRTDLHGMSKARKATIAEMHQRVRARLPHLARLVESVEDHRLRQAALLEAAVNTAIGGVFEHEGAHYRRTLHKSQLEDPLPLRPETVLVQDTATGELKDVSADEDHAFWTWAVVETLRHTGIRVEELMEITHLAIVSYRLQKTGELVPLLQIVPSKSNEERLLLVSPELASVLAAVVKRLRDENNGKIPLVARYDGHEKTTGPPLPHLFQRKTAWRPSVVSTTLIKRMLDDALTRTGLCDADGQPLRYTPHDFRRMFTTEAVAGGLPVHIAAKLLGHHGLATVESYLAVFQDDLITSYRSFLANRRATRPAEEYREPTEQEWREFEEHFTQRKLELGTCGRPYGTPCKHEHACIRCPMLRVDPKQRPRLIEIIRNLTDRIEEAQMNGWLGEVEGLNVSLTAAKDKLTSLIRSEERAKAQLGGQPTPLGMPVLGRPKGKTS
jgi:integrase